VHLDLTAGQNFLPANGESGCQEMTVTTKEVHAGGEDGHDEHIHNGLLHWGTHDI